ncbi:hypothetical protein ACIA5D_06975 [Actinoplanes sp. NPDC051513]|uniref:hypothetical protein n=1 Tax=Actinoplanes sp. NPDC051513 TaxID=3363908 RepID=UPI0037BA5594
MVAPLLLVLAAPGTLTLRALPGRRARPPGPPRCRAHHLGRLAEPGPARDRPRRAARPPPDQGRPPRRDDRHRTARAPGGRARKPLARKPLARASGAGVRPESR